MDSGEILAELIIMPAIMPSDPRLPCKKQKKIQQFHTSRIVNGLR